MAMKLSDISNPEERKKLIWAIVLGLLAIVFLWWALFGFGSTPKPTVKQTNSNSRPGLGPRRVGETVTAQTANEIKSAPLEQLRPLVISDYVPSAPEAKRRAISLSVNYGIALLNQSKFADAESQLREALKENGSAFTPPCTWELH